MGKVTPQSKGDLSNRPGCAGCSDKRCIYNGKQFVPGGTKDSRLFDCNSNKE
jgi:hypothetical protein